jgi:hypothetical protein
MNDAIARELRISIDKLSRLIEKQLRQREDGLRRWRDKNPELSKRCRRAATVLDEIHSRLLEKTLEVAERPKGDYDYLEHLNTPTMHEFLYHESKLSRFQNMIQIFGQLGGQ